MGERQARGPIHRRGTFVTAFFGIFMHEQRTLRYASAGHNPPRLKRCSDGSLHSLEDARGLPLGIVEGVEYEDADIELTVGDQMILYTDGITEARNDKGELFGTERLDHAIENCMIDAQGLIDATLRELHTFTNGRPADDDRTMVIARCDDAQLRRSLN